jgi:hypothetical protein
VTPVIVLFFTLVGTFAEPSPVVVAAAIKDPLHEMRDRGD